MRHVIVDVRNFVIFRNKRIYNENGLFEGIIAASDEITSFYRKVQFSSCFEKCLSCNNVAIREKK